MAFEVTVLYKRDNEFVHELWDYNAFYNGLYNTLLNEEIQVYVSYLNNYVYSEIDFMEIVKTEFGECTETDLLAEYNDLQSNDEYNTIDYLIEFEEIEGFVDDFIDAITSANIFGNITDNMVEEFICDNVFYNYYNFDTIIKTINRLEDMRVCPDVEDIIIESMINSGVRPETAYNFYEKWKYCINDNEVVDSYLEDLTTWQYDSITYFWND